MRFLKQSCLIGVIAALWGCASIDFDAPKTASYAVTDTDDTYLGKLVDEVVVQADPSPGEAAFYPITDGIDALAVRLLMAERAERTIDAQYYLITNDMVGNAFIQELLKAADRGVRVRLLLDDIQTQGYDIGMAALDSHPSFEVRIYNPFAQRSARLLDGITSFSRINRRMHNKSFTADNKISVIGGRNIADEYFGASESSKFGDLDVLAVGPVVDEVSSMFDTYWNNVAAVPVPALAKMPDDPEAELVTLRARIAESSAEAEKSAYAAAFDRRLGEYVGSDDDLLTWAPYKLVYDSPDKTQKKLAESAASIREPLFAALNGAEVEVLLLSPYFVPQKTGIEGLVELEKRGIEVVVITNSLAANNHAAVHGAYSPSRKPLLEQGIKIYEVRPDASVSGAVNEAGATTLHTKAFTVDRRHLFIGSFNFDPRSAFINTELGVIIDSPELTGIVAQRLTDLLPTQTYRVYLNEKNKLRWETTTDGKKVVYDQEPMTSWSTRATASFITILPIKSQL